MTWARRDDGSWMHRPWWKRWLNTALRAVQTSERPARLVVIATVCDESTEPPRVLGYAFRRVMHLA